MADEPVSATEFFEDPPDQDGDERPELRGGRGLKAGVFEDEDQDSRLPSLPYALVAVGGRAGGIDAFGQVLDHLLPNTGMTFAFILHTNSGQGGDIVTALQAHTPMPVLPMEDGQEPQPDHVYVLQPGLVAHMEGGTFRLEEDAGNLYRDAVINRFFWSVAESQRNLSVGIVLSGEDGDGAQGLTAIKGEGGFSLVQSPDSASDGSMPRTSIAADHVDVVLRPAELGPELARIATLLERPELRLLERGIAPESEEPVFQRILQLLRTQSGMELRQYKPETIRRRMARRMVLHRVDKMADYLAFLQVRAGEIRSLQEDILINVTRFFRDSDFWTALKSQVLPNILRDREPGKPVRIWCAGCSSGEEAFSLAIAVLEYITEHSLHSSVQVFGTDASERSVEKARIAVYPETIANDVSAERLSRNFLKVDNGYQVSKRVRDCCIFARQNLGTDPPFSHMDIVSCRNVMIYFNSNLQRQVISTFHYSLVPGGHLLLGMTEGLREYSDAFFAVDRKHRIYTKMGGSLPPSPPSARNFQLSPANPASAPSFNEEKQSWADADIQRAADRLVLARYGPPALVVDDRLNVIQSRGQNSPLLQLAYGTVSWKLTRLLRADVIDEVTEAVQRSIVEDIPVSVNVETFDEQGGPQHFKVDVLPIVNPGSRPRCFLILLQALNHPAGDAVNTPSSPVVQLAGDESERVVAQLRHDLSATRFHLQMLLAERDARNQELVSANEEIQSANEELQSTNEELETTKEELQSTNEELQTVNEELQKGNAALERTGNDYRNLLNSVNIPLLMLTSDLRIRQFTPPMQKLLSVLPSDLGRPVADLRLHLSIENIEPILTEVLETLGLHESEIKAADGRWYLLRVRPYRTSDNKIEGVVVALFDIDLLRSSQQGIIEARDFSRLLLESVPAPVLVVDKECSIRLANSAFRELVGMPRADLAGRSLPDLVRRLWGFADLGERMNELLDSEAGTTLTFEHEDSTPGGKTILVRGHVLSTGGERLVLLALEDVSIQRRAEKLLSEQKQLLEREVKVAAGELVRTQEELRGLTGYLFELQEEERQRVARELHDDIGQRLSLLALLLNGVKLANPDPNALAKLTEARGELQTLNTDVRELSHQLHPAILDDLGLSAALKALVEEFGRREKMPATYIGRNLPQLPPQPAVTALYRIAQEALRNVGKHAGNTHVKVILEARGDVLHLEVRDLGIGFDTESRQDVPRQGLGMISMQERARLAHGTLQVTSKLGEGATVIADVPFERNA